MLRGSLPFRCATAAILGLLSAFVLLALLGQGPTVAASIADSSPSAKAGAVASHDAATSILGDEDTDDGRSGDQLDFDEQGVGSVVPPALPQPFAVQIVSRVACSQLKPVSDPPLSTTIGREPDLPGFAHLQKQTVVLLI